MRPNILFVLLALCILCTLSVDAQIPRLLSYQGILTDTLGTPRPDGVYAFTFRLYESAAGGSPIWTEIKNLQVRRGLFFTALGDVTAFGAGVRFDRQYWLAIQVGGEPMLSPRIALTSVGYSFSAIKSDTAQFALTSPPQAFVDSARIAGTIPDNTVTSAKILDGTIAAADIATSAVTTTQILDGTIATADIADGAVTLAKHADGSVNSAKIVDGAVATVDIADGAITSGKILDGTILFADIGINAASANQVIKRNPANTAWIAAPDETGIGEAWRLTGNLGTTAGTNFVGTTDAQAFDIRTNNLLRTRITTKGQIETYNTGRSVFVGEGAGASDDTTDNRNVFVGYQAGFSNTTGYWNTANGAGALYSNTTGNANTASGSYALGSNTTGSNNTAIGLSALYFNTEGNYNTANGENALRSNTTGYSNTANGGSALRENTTGHSNTANGLFALHLNTTGFRNTALGVLAGSSVTTGSNNTCIGYNAQVPSAIVSNQVRIGNTAVSYAGVQVGWTITSDRIYKEDILPIGLGLGLISKLNPVSYSRKSDEKNRTEYGLIAQEVEEVLKELGIENHAILTITDEGMYELRYNDLMAPMIKAIQELNNQSREQRAENAKLRAMNEELASRLSELEALVKSLAEQKRDGEKKLLGKLK